MDNSASPFGDLALPLFMSPDESRPGDIHLWKPRNRTGHYETDFEAGKLHARTVIDIARLQKSPDFVAVMLGEVIRADLSHLEAGFLSEIASRAYVGSHN